MSRSKLLIKNLSVLGVEAGPFSSQIKESTVQKALLLGVLLKGYRIRGVYLSTVQVDGLDATDRLIEMIQRDKIQVDLIVVGSVCIAGFNLLDLKRIHETLGVPVIVTVSDRPRKSKVEGALKKHFRDWRKRLEAIESAGPLRRTLVRGKPVYMATVGIEPRVAGSIVRDLAVLGKLPEPLRCAEILARGLSGIIS
jgi:endonuclease V-like protein UPF0215 family